MKLFFTIFTLLFSSNALAQTYKNDDGFYSGLDPTKIDDRKSNLDKSFDAKNKPVDGKYYGYKFSEGGIFFAPEALRVVKTPRNGITNSSGNVAGQQGYNSNHSDNINYNLKANLGYDFDKSVSGFVTYDMGSFSYDATQKSVLLDPSQNREVGAGSQINFSNDLKVKVSYSKQNTSVPTGDGGQIKSDIIRFGTSYNF